jgi:integrase
MKLTAKRVLRALKKPGRYPDGANLYLQVATPGKASWLLRYAHDGRERMLGLGPLADFTLAEARDRAKAARQLLRDGIDPLDQKRAQKAQRALAAARLMTFEQAARAWHSQHEGGWKNPKHGRQVLETLATYVFTRIGALPVGSIDTGLVLKCVEPIWADKTETASRVRGRIESVLDWATVRGYRQGDNPARWKGHLAEVLPAKAKIARTTHHAALPYVQIAEFMADLRTRDGVAARALEVAILTAARTGEVIGARWDEIDLEVRTWTVPAGRMKNGREHRVPLSDRALEILQEGPREEGNDFIFIGASAGSGLSNTALTRVLRQMQRRDVTVHGFRSTFMDWAHDKTAFPKVVIDMALAHVVGDKVEAAYRRGDLFAKRKQLMAAWAAYCAKLPANGDVVVPLRGRR